MGRWSARKKWREGGLNFTELKEKYYNKRHETCGTIIVATFAQEDGQYWNYGFHCMKCGQVIVMRECKRCGNKMVVVESLKAEDLWVCVQCRGLETEEKEKQETIKYLDNQHKIIKKQYDKAFPKKKQTDISRFF